MTYFPIVEINAEWYDQKLILQILNVITFGIAMFLNFLSSVISTNSLSYITD